MSSSYTLDYLEQCRKEAAAVPLQSKSLHGGASVLLGTGGNIAILTQHSSVLLVDAGWKTVETQIVNALSQVSSLPPSHLINTHWHYDHTDGNAWLNAKGAEITAHRNTLSRLAEPQYNDLLGAVFPASPAVGLPTHLFDEELKIRVDDVTIAMQHYGPAHTDGDIRVHFEELDILHVGDTWSNGLYPYIDSASGGHIDGMIQATVANLQHASAATTIIPGHGPVGNKEELQRSLDMLTDARALVKELKRQGHTLAEVITSRPMASYAKWFSGSFVPVELFLHCIYAAV